jgi:drug/metabolite transporter (DMT)-like permease
MSKKSRLYLKLVLVTLFWGGTFLTGQITSKSISPVLSAFGRFLAASLFLAVVLPLRERKWQRPTKKQLLLILAAAATGIVSYNLFFFSGLKLIETNRAALIVALNPVMIMLIASMVRMERLTLGRVLGIVVALLGVSLVLTRANLADLQTSVGRGELLIFGCVISWALFTLIGRQLVGDLTPLTVTTYASIAGTLGLLVPAARELPDLLHISWPVWLSLVYLGVFGTGLGFVWYYDGVRDIGPTRASIFINLVPVWATLVGTLFLNERIVPATLLGGVFIITGVTITNLTGRNKIPSQDKTS